MSTATLQEKLNQLGTDTDLMHQIVHGDAETDVPTDGGSVPSVRKLFAEISSREADGVAAAQTLASSAMTEAGAARTAAQDAVDRVDQLETTLELPSAPPTESGRSLMVAPEGGWTLGGSAAAKNVGTGPDDVPTNADLETVLGDVAFLDAGTAEGNAVILGPGGALPAVSGANLTNIPGATVYTSDLFTITAYGGYSLTHGLGGKPDLVELEVECTSGPAGDTSTAYLAIGGIARLPLGVCQATTANHGAQVDIPNNTTIGIRIGAGITLWYFNTALLYSITLSKFKMRVRAIKF